MAVAIALAACGPAPAQDDSETFTAADRDEIASVRENLQRYLLARDASSIRELLSEDATVILPGGSVITAETALQRLMTDGPPLSELLLEPEKLDGRATLAYEHARFSAILGGEAARSTSASGDFLWILVEDSPDRWRVAAVSLSADVAFPRIDEPRIEVRSPLQGDLVYVDGSHRGQTNVTVVLEEGDYGLVLIDPETLDTLCTRSVSLRLDQRICYVCPRDGRRAFDRCPSETGN